MLPTPLPAALSPQHWPFDLDWLPATAHLVGGCVRDALLGRTSEHLDLDFVLPERPVEIAAAMAEHYQAGFVCLDAEHQIARVVFPQVTVDLALQVGDNLMTDLQRRDFTVNAIAAHPRTHALVDPLNGQRDLQQKSMRMVSAQNLRDDPLRLLRAYRQAAQLGFALEPDTQAMIRQLAPQLKTVAAERVRVELGYLLHQPQGTSWLHALAADGLLTLWFPAITPQRLTQLEAIDRAFTELDGRWPALSSRLTQPLNHQAQGSEAAQRTLRTIVKLMVLTGPQPDLAKRTLSALTYARAEISGVTTLLQTEQWLSALPNRNHLSRAEQYELFQRIGDFFPALALWLQAREGPQSLVATLMTEYLNPDSPVAHPRPFLNGKALMVALDLPPGPQIGQLLAQLGVAQAEGRVTCEADAIALAQTLIAHNNPGDSSPSTS